MIYDVIIIGGGAAGMMAAGTAGEKGLSVLLLEKNGKLGRKLAITGKGRCNVCNNCTREEFFDNIPTNPRFLYSSYSAFDKDDTMAFFEGLGVPLKTERGNRVFPVSDKAADIVSALDRFVRKNKVTVKQAAALSAKKEDVFTVATDRGTFQGRMLLITTGGCSYPATGSTGDGYALAKAFGHSIVTPKPSLVPLVTREKWPSECMGLSLKNVTVTLMQRDKVLYSELGEMLFTHFGVSGPLVLSASGHIRDISKPHSIHIDLKPALDSKKLDLRIQRDFEEYKNREIINSLSKLLPAKLIPVIVRLSGIPADKRVNSVTREERLRLGALIKDVTLDIAAFRPIDEAIITSGGVSVKEIDPKTMESKLVKGLYFAGEIIDTDAYTGGFNLQIAWSTAYAAASAMTPDTESI